MKNAATSILAVLVVAAVVIGAAWYKGQRAETAVEEPSRAASGTPQAVAEAGTAGTEMADAALTADEARLPRLVDLGADKCIPCKKMAPILEQLREEYKGRLDVEVIDVWKNPNAGLPYRIRVIPTQILYSREGKEVWRHEGFISKNDLKALFAEKVGVE